MKTMIKAIVSYVLGAAIVGVLVGLLFYGLGKLLHDPSLYSDGAAVSYGITGAVVGLVVPPAVAWLYKKMGWSTGKAANPKA